MMQAMNSNIPNEENAGDVFGKGGMQAVMDSLPLRGMIMFAGGNKEVEAGIQRLIDALNA